MSEPQESQQNQGTSTRQPVFLLPGAITMLLGLIIAIHLARVFVLNPDGVDQLFTWFAFWPHRFAAPDQVIGGLWPLLWTPVTHAFLHAGWDHLLLNSAWLAIFGTPVARRYGGVATWVVFLLGALAGAALFAITPMSATAYLVGASGGIAGLTGAACRFMFQPVVVEKNEETGAVRVLGRRTATLKELATKGQTRFFIAMWLILNAAVPFLPILIGADSGIAWQAHLGGFIAGLLVVPLLDRRAERTKS